MLCAVLMAPNLGFGMQKSWTGSGSEANEMATLWEKIARKSQRVFLENIFQISFVLLPLSFSGSVLYWLNLRVEQRVC